MNQFQVKRGLAFKLSLYLVTSIIIVFVVILSYDYYATRESVITNAREYTSALAESVTNKIEIQLNAVQKLAQTLAQTIEFTDLNTREINDLLKGVVDNNPVIYGCTIAYEPYTFDKSKLYFDPYYYKPEGVGKFYDNDNDAEYNYFKWDWYTIPKKLNKGTWSEPYFDEGGGDIKMVTYSQPFYKKINGERKFCGVIACDISLEWLMTYVSIIKVFNSGSSFIISPKGIFIEHWNKDYIMNETIFSVAEKYNSRKLKEIAQNMINNMSGFDKYYFRKLNKEYYISYSPLKSTDWSIGIVVPTDEVLSELNVETLKLFIMGLVGYVLSMVIIIYLAKKLTVPLRKLANATYDIGEGNFNGMIPSINSSDEIGVLSRSFNNMQKNLIKYIENLQETTAAKEKIERELSIAREIQQNIIPHNFPDRKEFEIYALLTPAREVGGDLYDFFFMDDQHFCFTVGDVSGKGVPAALFMAITKTLLRAKAGESANAGNILTAMNSDLCRDNESSMFVTLFLGILDINTGELEYCNAGHNPPVIHTSNKGFYYFHKDSAQPPLGFCEGVSYKSYKIKLSCEDIFTLYTDGITEAMNADNIQFSEDKLLEVLTANKNSSVVKMAEKVKEAVELHAAGTVQSDDITLLILKYCKQ